MKHHHHAPPRGASLVALAAVIGLAFFLVPAQHLSASRRPPIPVGLIAPLSGGSAASGQAILRGMTLAMDEINRTGGIFGRRLAIVTRDIQNDPAAGVAALQELVDEHHTVAVFGGIYSPVMMAQLDLVHRLRIPLINPWGSMAAITKNGRNPNYVYRVSVSDDEADEFLARYLADVVGARKPGIIADTTDWGEANTKGLIAWTTRLGVPAVAVERFDQGDTDMSSQLRRLRTASVDALLMVANAPEGAAIVRGLATLGWKVPIVSHWGISGGRFVELGGVDNAEGVLTLQTISFYGPLSPRARQVVQAYHQTFQTRQTDEIMAPVGVAHGYDGMHLLAQAIRQAGSTDGPSIRAAFEHLRPYDGVVKRYAPPFTPIRHDALLAQDYIMTVWRGGKLVPAAQPRLSR